MFISFLVLIGTVLAVNNDQPDVFMYSRDSRDKTGLVYMCVTSGFNTSDIILNIKKNRCVLTEKDGVKTEGVKPFRGNTYQRSDHVTILKSNESHFSCEVIHAASRFRVEKVWDPKSNGKGRIISSKFKDTNKPVVFVFARNATTETVVFSCLASGFYPSNIIMNMKRNGRILTREDGLESSGICSNEDDAFKRRDSVEIKKSDKSNYSCEVIHDASGTRVEKVWDLPQVEMFSHIASVGAQISSHRILMCRVKSINTKDIILNIKKNRCVLSKEDGVETTGVKPAKDTYWRSDSVNIPQSDKSHYSCEIIHASSSFHVEKIWDPESDGGGRIISSKFIETNQRAPLVKMFAENSKVQTNVILMCLVSGFYPNNITVIMKRNGRILTREDGVKSSVCSNEDDTFQRRDSVEIKKSDKSNYSCKIIDAASGSHEETFWDHRLPDDSGDYTGYFIGAALFLLALVLVGWFKRPILGAAARLFTSDSDTNTDLASECQSLNPSSSNPSIGEQTKEEKFK